LGKKIMEEFEMDTPSANNAQQNRPAAAPAAATARPLVIEIKPGQASEGLVGYFKPGEYEGKSVDELVRSTMNSQSLNDFERGLSADIEKNLRSGKLLYQGKEVKGQAAQYAVEQTSDEGEKYLYVELKAIQPQEGGDGYNI
jgi:hypothetical protein